jgi:signal peptidase II
MSANARDWKGTFTPIVVAMVVVIALDQLSKAWALGLDECSVAGHRSVISLCRTYNQGMAFSVGWGAGGLIAAVAVLIVGGLLFAARSMPLSSRIVVGAICGGAAGNVIDRAFRSPLPNSGVSGFMSGAVVDFISTKYFATFNVADSAVVAGSFLLVVLIWRTPEPDEGSPSES